MLYSITVSSLHNLYLEVIIVKKTLSEKNFEIMAKGLFVFMIAFALLFAERIASNIHWIISMRDFYDVMPSSDKAYYLWNYPSNVIESVAFIITAVLSCFILWRCLKAKTPFVPKMGRYLRIIAFTILAALLLMFIMRIIAETIAGDGIHNEYRGFLNGGDGIFVTILIMLSYIFDRGFELQQESDETL